MPVLTHPAFVGKMLVCCLYLPNGNPAPGPKFDYKMTWFKRLKQIAPRLVAAGVDTHVRGWEKSSDHAPTWIILADEDES